MKILIPRVIHWSAALLFVVSVALLLFITVGVACAYIQEAGWMQFSFLEIKQAPAAVMLKIPFVQLVLSFPPSSPEVLLMIAFFSFYAYYFFLMKNFFGIFRQQQTFSPASIRTARHFLLINFVPVLCWLGFCAYYLLSGKQNVRYFNEDFFILPIHLFVIIMVFLYTDILKKGIALQEQADFTI